MRWEDWISSVVPAIKGVSYVPHPPQRIPSGSLPLMYVRAATSVSGTDNTTLTRFVTETYGVQIVVLLRPLSLGTVAGTTREQWEIGTALNEQMREKMPNLIGSYDTTTEIITDEASATYPAVVCTVTGVVTFGAT